LKKCEPDDTLILIRFTNLQTGWGPPTTHQFTNRMRSTHHPSGLQFFYLMTTIRGGVRFTTYKPDGTPHPVHPVNNLWTRHQAIRFSNFKKWEPEQKLQSCSIKEGYLDNFNKGSCGIKILYTVAGREYGSEGRICPTSPLYKSWPNY